MKKVLIAALLAGMSLSATAAQTIRFATEASYPPFELVDANNKSSALTSIWLTRCVKRWTRPAPLLTRLSIA
ncbi:ABC transporter arginine-binding protein 2 (plasmid) [Klebsiella aerogenes]|nr:ABC transporter arginine-binding protein 2 [Klebsiella aerogenes]